MAAQEAVAAPPINSSQGMSPFNIAGTASTSTPLTVGDVISQLPPELVRAGALPHEQPLSLPPTLLENALRGGQPALPVFELYRVCPALFQTPVSPQDPRMVGLPASKLPALIAKAREGAVHANGGMPAGTSAAFATQISSPSPFATGVPASPFAAAAPASPFSAASGSAVPPASPFGMAAGAPAAGMPFPASPFAGTTSPFPSTRGGEPPAGKPAPGLFSMPAESAPAAAASQPASPFGMPPATPQNGSITSLFTPKSQDSASTPAAMPPRGAVPSGFGMPGAGAPLLGGSAFGSPPAAVAGGSSPFAALQPGPSMPAAGQASLFGAQAAASTTAPAPASGPLGSPAGDGGTAAAAPLFSNVAPSTPLNGMSPFGSAAPAGASPFASLAPQTASGPAPASFSLPNSSMQTPAPGPGFGQQAAGASAFATPGFGAPPASLGGGGPSASAQAKLSFAAMLYGLSAEDLGFNPAMVPAWITFQVPASTLKEQIGSGAVVMELGALIDGISDVGFRNTLSTAKRGLQIKLPQNEVLQAVSGSAPATPSAPLGAFVAPKPALQTGAAVPVNGAGAFVIQPGAPAGQVSRVEPASAAPPSFFAAAPPEGGGAAAGPESVFGSTPKAAVEHNPLGQLAGGEGQPTPAVPFGGVAVPAAPVPVVPTAFSFPQAPAVAPSPVTPTAMAMPQQPQAQPGGMFKPMGGAAVTAFGPAHSTGSPPITSSLGVVNKPFDPFASSGSHTGALPGASAPAAEAGLSSAQLLGQSVLGAAASQLPAFSTPPVLQPAAAGMASAFASPFGSPLPATPEKAAAPFVPASFAPALEARPTTSTPSVPLFSETAPPPAEMRVPASAPAPPAAQAAGGGAASGKHSFLGLAPLDTQTDQLMLRALLGTEEKLNAQRVVELLACQPGLSACVCLQGGQVLGHADKSKADAADFQRQAPDIARQLRGLAPLIGIDGAETFTLNAGGRLITFCFPGSATIGVLHEAEPSNGLRDKITLIARELARMLA